jgi:hypothetical protein
VLFGANPAAVDAAAAALLGFDIEKIPIVEHAFHTRGFPLADFAWREVECKSNHDAWNRSVAELAGSPDTLAVRPHFGWIGHIEAARPAAVAQP